MSSRILDEFGRPIPTKEDAIIALMNKTTEDNLRTINEAMFRRTPMVLDQFGKNLLPPEPGSLSGFVEVLKNGEKYSWSGSRMQSPIEFEEERRAGL